MFRVFDLLLASVIGSLLFPLFLVLTIWAWIDTGKPIFAQDRVGRFGKCFKLYKFRTMPVTCLSVPTHEADMSQVTWMGAFLRRTKLDEMPQILNVIRGEMSFVGPRPCLPTQKSLLEKRNALKLLEVRPGITGLSQVRGIDMSRPNELLISDVEMIRSMSVQLYLKLLWLTLAR